MTPFIILLITSIHYIANLLPSLFSLSIYQVGRGVDLREVGRSGLRFEGERIEKLTFVIVRQWS